MFSGIIMPRLRVQLWFLLMIDLVILVKFPGNSLPIPHHAEEDISKVLSLASVKTRPERYTVMPKELVRTLVGLNTREYKRTFFKRR